MSSERSEAPPFLEVCRDLLTSEFAIRFQASGESMYPTIRDGEFIEVAPLGCGREPRRGDIVLYESAGRLVCHRLVRLGGAPLFPGFVLQGDARWAGEESVLAGQALGVATAVMRNGSRRRLRGWVARFRDASRRLAGSVRRTLIGSSLPV
ncbi:MAG: S24/S26 family peptidase [Thermoanaerobaculia bacterium]